MLAINGHAIFSTPLRKARTATDLIGRRALTVPKTDAAHSSDRERPIRSIMNTDSGDHEHPLALA